MKTVHKAGDIEHKVKELVDQLEEWKNKYLRALADYQNLEKRNREQIEDIKTYAAESLIKRLLPVLDTLEKAYEHLQDPGLALVVKEFQKVLTDAGVEKIEVASSVFDPNTMDCIEVVDGPENKVMSVVMPGYMLRNKVIRAAKVRVGKIHDHKEDHTEVDKNIKE